ncbi:hypothetical protein DVH05_026967 [Phytophthora capsici]|nr:hypothetical protein DVH05_026967 [Phytophthora capsici]
MEHAVFASLTPGQQETLKKLMSLLGPEGIAHLASQGPEAVSARLEAFASYEKAFLKHVQERVSATASAASSAAASSTHEWSNRLCPQALEVHRTNHRNRKDVSQGILTCAFFNSCKLKLHKAVRALLAWCKAMPANW